jgi:glucosylceramidase
MKFVYQISFLSVFLTLSLTNPLLASPPTVEWYLTKFDGSVLLERQKLPLVVSDTAKPTKTILIDTTQKYQRVDGFGFNLTGSSAMLLHNMEGSARGRLLNELFGFDANSISVSYLRISIGASDLSPSVYSYDDVRGGDDDSLSHFDLGQDKESLIPILKEILLINPKIKLVASPWSAPSWMKDNNSFIGGSLQKKYYERYVLYFVKYLKAMAANGINIDAVTPQNEPQALHNNPSMGFLAEDELVFVRQLGKAFSKNGIKTKIIIWDHNCDNPSFAIKILSDPIAKLYVAGTAFHLYSGNINVLGELHNMFPDRNIYFTEQYTDRNGTFGTDLKWHMKNVLIGAMRNWSKNVLEWNLANDPKYGPHTEGGCSVCKGALTIDGNKIVRNVSYYVIAHASKFVPQGSMRVGSNIVGDLNTVAFLTPTGKQVLIVENDGKKTENFSIKSDGQLMSATLEAGSVATFTW